MSRSKALKLNMIATLSSELITFISGLILPRLMLLYFGSSCNGLIGSISQFLGFSAVLRAGIGGAVRAALYKPLAENDIPEINRIMSGTSKYMKKIGMIIGTAIIGFALIYPFVVKDEYDLFFSFEMVMIIGLATFVDNYFGIKCKILLQADQKYYIQIGITAISNFLVLVVSVILILANCNIQTVKLCATLAILSGPLLLNIYVKKNYNINLKEESEELDIKGRWDAFAQQVATIVNSNVDLVLLTMMTSLKEISVYTVHFMIVSNMGKIVNSCVSGINSTFGNIIAKNEKENLLNSFMFIEWLMFGVCGVLYTVTAIMLPEFIMLYTASVNDVNYIRPVFATVMVITTMINSIRIPYQMLVEAAGKFKETRNGAVLEIFVNIGLSILFIKQFGLVGVLLGTLVASTIRTIEYAIFCEKNILHVNILHIFYHAILISVSCFAIYFFAKYVLVFNCANYMIWAVKSLLCVFIAGGVILCVSIIFYRNQVKYLFNRIKMRIK